jgi:hypothetical protein
MNRKLSAGRLDRLMIKIKTAVWFDFSFDGEFSAGYLDMLVIIIKTARRMLTQEEEKRCFSGYGKS